MPRLLSLVAGLVLAVPLGARAQADTLVSVRTQGAIVKPAQAPVTDARLRSLSVPAGFRITQYASGLPAPRMLALGPQGQVYVSSRDSGQVILVPDRNRDGLADQPQVVARIPHAHGLAVHDGHLYVAAIRNLYRLPIRPDGTLGDTQRIAHDLPDAGQHPNRTLRFGPDGWLYLSVGSSCNACPEPNPESATMLRMRPDGSQRTIYAEGLRNTIGFDWHPVSGELFGIDHGMDWLGDDVPEEVNRLQPGKHYGWPYVYADSRANLSDEPPAGQSHRQFAAQAQEPLLLLTPHAAPLDFRFYTGQQFPAQYRNQALATYHGSWNRSTPVGYKLVWIQFVNGVPVGETDFITGWLSPDGKQHFGRPVGLLQLPDGSVLVSDDASGNLYRVQYTQ